MKGQKCRVGGYGKYARKLIQQTKAKITANWLLIFPFALSW